MSDLTINEVVANVATAGPIGAAFAPVLQNCADRLSVLAQEIDEAKSDEMTTAEILALGAKSESESLRRRIEAYNDARKALRQEFREIADAVVGKSFIDTTTLVQEAKSVHAEALTAVKTVERFTGEPVVNNFYAVVAKPEGAGMRSFYKGWAEKA